MEENLEKNCKYNVSWIFKIFISRLLYFKHRLNINNTKLFLYWLLNQTQMDPLFGGRREQVSSNFVSRRVKSIAVSDKEAKGENVCMRFAIKARLKEALFRVITGETGSS